MLRIIRQETEVTDISKNKKIKSLPHKKFVADVIETTFLGQAPEPENAITRFYGLNAAAVINKPKAILICGLINDAVNTMIDNPRLNSVGESYIGIPLYRKYLSRKLAESLQPHYEHNHRGQHSQKHESLDIKKEELKSSDNPLAKQIREDIKEVTDEFDKEVARNQLNQPRRAAIAGAIARYGVLASRSDAHRYDSSAVPSPMPHPQPQPHPHSSPSAPYDYEQQNDGIYGMQFNCRSYHH